MTLATAGLPRLFGAGMPIIALRRPKSQPRELAESDAGVPKG